ncbi:NUDIX domain-containing protein [Streptomyces olivoreticuli]
MTARYRSIVDVFMLLQRDDGRVLLVRRTGDTYASGQLCPPSGHLEEGESVLAGAIREAAEEVGVGVDVADVSFAHLIHHRSPEGEARLGTAFLAQRWSGTPCNREPRKHSELVWADPATPPADCVAYTAALLAMVDAGARCSVHGWTGAGSLLAVPTGRQRCVPVPAARTQQAPSCDRGGQEVLAARRAMVARLDADRVLQDGRLREALMSVPREVLLPRTPVASRRGSVLPGCWTEGCGRCGA